MAGAAEKLNRTLRRNAAGQGASPHGAKRRRMRRSQGHRSLKGRLTSWLFLLPSLLGVAVFFVVPFGLVVDYSLVNNPVQHVYVGMDNFVRTWNNTAFRLAAFNTLRFSLTAVPLAVALSLLLAVLMEGSIPGKSFFRSFFLSPMMVPIASVILIWQVLFDYNGLVNVWITGLGLERIDWLKSAHAQLVILLLFLWKNLGYNMLLFMAGLSAIPQDQVEVARLEGASDRRIFWTIKLRYLSSTLMFVTIMSLINSFKVFREVYLLTGEYPFDALYMLQHFMNNTFLSLDYQKLSSAAIIMSAAMVIIIGILFITEDLMDRDLE